MFNLAPWYYRTLLQDNPIIEKPEFFLSTSLNGKIKFEAVVDLKKNLKPKWLSTSSIYRNCDGSGSDKYKNVAVYKAISEALERWAFYSLIDSGEKGCGFEIDPTTTGIAAFPSWKVTQARENARAEAVERWCIHEFNRGNIPIKNHETLTPGLLHYELVSSFSDIKISLLCFKNDKFYSYGFAADSTLEKSFNKALIELDRNNSMLLRHYLKNNNDIITTRPLVSAPVDKTILYFSTDDGYLNFNDKLQKASKKIISQNPKIVCDKELHGDWSRYTKVWRFLLEDSYFDCSQDHTFFMF